MVPSPDPTIWQTVAGGVAILICLWWIRSLQKDKAAAQEMADKRADEMLATVKMVVPALENSSAAIRESADLTVRQSQALAAVEVIIREADRRHS